MAGFAIVDGMLVPLEAAVVPITDIQFTHGLGVYETLAHDADPEPNFVRLRESAAAIGVEMPDEDVLRAEIARIVAAAGPCWIVIDLTGDGRRIVWTRAFEPERRHRAVRCGRAPHVDHPLLPGSVKHRSRGAWVAELRRRPGVDELLFVDADGRFTEGSSCAVLAVVGGAVWTAPWDHRILRSTTLDRLLDHARARGIDVVRAGPLAQGPWDALYIASTTRSIAPVIELDGTPLPGWDPVGRALAAADDALA
jgi:branched-subunit amino acid aminotransferase/4-amino-4-deoxychorismate lyase